VVDFNEFKDSYRDQVNKSISFSGKGLDFFTAVKADWLREIIRTQAENGRRPRVLDIGCGHGFIHSLLRDTDVDLVGTDLATDVLTLARDLNPGVCYTSYDGTRLPFASEAFDITFAICVMHHVPPELWNGFLTEMKRVVKPRGLAVVFEHNPYNPLTRYVVASNDIDRDAVLLSSVRLKRLMLQSGFKSADSRFILFSPFDHRFFRWLDTSMGWCPFGAQYYVMGRR